MTNCIRCGADFKEEQVSYCGFCGASVTHDHDPSGPDPLIGQVIDDRYRVLARIGEGGMGTVYKVEHVHIKKFMALKLLRKEYSASPDIVRRFKREAQAASRLSNVHTVVVFDFGRTQSGALYITMEWIEGESLLAILAKEGPLPWRRAAKIAHQVAVSLSEAHAKGVVHRDVKPENIMVVKTASGGDFVKILDFGLAKMIEMDHLGESITSHGSIVGTPYYMSPEQIHGDDIDARSDLYSLGCVLYRLLCGDPPFMARHPIAILQMHMNDPMPPLEQKMEGRPLPVSLEGLINDALAKNRDDRPANADVMRLRLEETLAETAIPRPVSESPDGPESTYADPVSPVAGFDDWHWDTALRISDRRDWEVFERSMRNRRLTRTIVVITLLLGLAGAITYKGLDEDWFPSTRESEPNNDPAHATRLLSGQPLKGKISKRLSPVQGDQDFYVVNHPKAPGDHLVRVELQGIANMSLDLHLYGIQGGEPLIHASGLGGRSVICARRLPADGCLLRVRERPRPGLSPTENISDDYTIEATVSRPAPDSESEPNDRADDANPLRLGQWVAGTVCPAGDEDWFQVDTTSVKGKRLKIEFAASAGAEKARTQFYSKERVPVPDRTETRADLVYAVVRGAPDIKGEPTYRLRVTAF